MKCLYIIAGANGGDQIVLAATQTKGKDINIFSNELYLNFRGNNA